MRFLAKPTESAARELSYGGGDNSRLRDALVADQMGFCAYTERYLLTDDTIAVEHFDSRLKGHDDWRNWYAVKQTSNQQKRNKERAHQGAGFHLSRFFQDATALEARIEYDRASFMFFESDPDDQEARDLLDYLSVNAPSNVDNRRRHVQRLQEIFDAAKYDRDERLDYFQRRPEELHFITAVEAALEIELQEAIPQQPLGLSQNRR